MKCIKPLSILIISTALLLSGCSKKLQSIDGDVSQTAIEMKNMTKVQNDVNEIMGESCDYVLENMGTPYNIIYSISYDSLDDVSELEQLKNLESLEIEYAGLLYPKYTSDYKLDGSAIYIEIKDNKVSDVQTCEFKNFDITQVGESSGVLISYKECDKIDTDFDEEELANYVDKDIKSLSDVVQDKQCEYNLYSKSDDNLEVKFYQTEKGEYLIVATENDKIKYLEEKDCTDLLTVLESKLK